MSLKPAETVKNSQFLCRQYYFSDYALSINYKNVVVKITTNLINQQVTINTSKGTRLSVREQGGKFLPYSKTLCYEAD
jgi:hypothetical protein